MSASTITTITLIVVAGVILIEELPDFCKHLYLYFSVKSAEYHVTQSEMEAAIFSGAKVLIALLLIGERNRIVDFIESRNKPDDKEIEE